jgi:hypothetical protein
MIGRLHLKIVFSIVLLAGLVANQSGLAKGAHTQHTGASAKRTNSVHTKPVEGIDTSVTVLPPRGGLARGKQNSNATLKIVKPGNLTQRSNVTAAIKPPVVRNAIGQPVKSNSVTVGALRLAPSLQAPGTVAKGGVHLPSPPSPIRPLNVGSTNRPSVAPLGVGGPARASNGINGTTVQTKH